LVAAAILGAFLAVGIANARELTFDERVQAQEAIERVYWSHRIWPKENSTPKPALSSAMSDEAIRSKVRDYLEKSSALDVVWHRPITGEQLQAELDRMARNTHDGATLRELFEALGDDPTLIAETLARDTLAVRLVRDLYATDDRFHGALRKQAEAALAACGTIECMGSMGKSLQKTTWKRRKEGAEILEAKTALHTNLLDGREWNAHVAYLRRILGRSSGALPVGIWSRLEETPDAFVATAVIVQNEAELTIATQVWPKIPFEAWWQAQRESVDSSAIHSAGIFSLPTTAVSGCTPDSWSSSVIPAPRNGHAAVWTGSEMIAWGGFADRYPGTTAGGAGPNRYA
jgi:hypothetical protein